MKLQTLLIMYINASNWNLPQASIAQSEESVRCVCLKVPGSIPGRGTFFVVELNALPRLVVRIKRTARSADRDVT